MPTKKTIQLTLPRILPYILIGAGIVGLISSFVLTYDKMELLKNPQFVPNCNLDPVLSCGSVMHTAQSSAFGFPNPWLGLAAFSVMLTVGVSLVAGASFRRWFWVAFEAGMALALVFAGWLLFESIYRIGALCPYCLAVDAVLIISFWYLTLYELQAGHIRLPARLTPAAVFVRRHHGEVLVIVFLALIAIILQHFWYYYGQHI